MPSENGSRLDQQAPTQHPLLTMRLFVQRDSLWNRDAQLQLHITYEIKCTETPTSERRLRKHLLYARK
ncbi:hypothetical protein AC249_AIPGENE13849 [Exaiptasia diaphana]|nr:hypothetical protein AC249_AIPGENE13849 [Exaiptasia diaphana]